MKVISSGLNLARRLELTEAHACAQFAVARRKTMPESGADWLEAGGAYVVFDGIDSPVTQTFGLGMSEPITERLLDTIEHFFYQRGADVRHEVCPLAGVAALDLLCRRGYRPIEVSSVMYRGVERPADELPANIRVTLVDPADAAVWNAVNARGWSHDHPEQLDFLMEFSAIGAAREDTPSFLAELDGVPAAAASLCMHEGTALFAGAATIPELRRRGLQSALLAERMRYACDHGCDLAMMVAEAGGESQRNAERQGFRIAYTRTKWQLFR